MTLLYHFPLQETTEVSKVKGTRYKEDDDGVLTAVGEITIDSNDSSDQPLSDFSKPVTDGIDDIVETLADLVLSVSLPQTSGTFKHFAYVSNNDLVGGSITIQSEKNGNPIFQIETDGGNGHYIFFHAGSNSWYYCVIANTRLSIDATNSSSVTWTLLDLDIESIFVPGIDTPFPALADVLNSGYHVSWNHDVFRVENLLARTVQRLNGVFNDASFVSFWAYINNTWTFVTFDGSTVAFNNVLQVDYSTIFAITLNPFTLFSGQPLKILDLKFYNSTPTFQDIFHHPRKPSFGFFQLSHSSNIGIAGNQLDDSLAVFSHSSTNQDQLLATLRIGNLHADNTSLKGVLHLNTNDGSIVFPTNFYSNNGESNRNTTVDGVKMYYKTYTGPEVGTTLAGHHGGLYFTCGYDDASRDDFNLAILSSGVVQINSDLHSMGALFVGDKYNGVFMKENPHRDNYRGVISLNGGYDGITGANGDFTPHYGMFLHNDTSGWKTWITGHAGLNLQVTNSTVAALTPGKMTIHGDHKVTGLIELSNLYLTDNAMWHINCKGKSHASFTWSVAPHPSGDLYLNCASLDANADINNVSDTYYPKIKMFVNGGHGHWNNNHWANSPIAEFGLWDVRLMNRVTIRDVEYIGGHQYHTTLSTFGRTDRAGHYNYGILMNAASTWVNCVDDGELHLLHNGDAQLTIKRTSPGSAYKEVNISTDLNVAGFIRYTWGYYSKFR